MHVYQNRPPQPRPGPRIYCTPKPAKAKSRPFPKRPSTLQILLDAALKYQPKE